MKKTLILLILTVGVIYLCRENEYVEIPNSSIRFRVISNSNNLKDIKNKEKIKEELSNKISYILNNSKTYKEADKVIEHNLDVLDKTVQKSLEINNISMNYNVSYGENYFPEKIYKGVTYKSGNYKSYVVTLGEGKGDNFWCVLFPPLCLIDEDVDSNEYRFLVKDIIDKYSIE